MNRLINSLVLMLFALILALPAKAAPIETAFTYQGSLSQSGGPATGVFDFRFDLFGSPDTGSPLTSSRLLDDVQVVDGVFSVELDFDSGAFVGQQLWLSIEVRDGNESGSYTLLTPRQKITVTPYALHAEFVSIDAVGTDQIIDNSIQVSDLAFDPVTQSELTAHASDTDAHWNAGEVVPLGSGGTSATTPTGARSNLGAAASGANSDITELSGLSTPLSVAQGGTGAATASDARDGLGVTTAISDHAGVADAHHARYTDAEALAAVGLAQPDVAFLATLAADQSISASGAFEVTNWTTTGNPRFDLGDDLNGAAGHFVAPMPGLYLVTGMVRVDQFDVGYGGLGLSINDVQDSDLWSYTGALGLADDFDNLQVNAVLELSQGDEVSLYFSSPSDTNYVLKRGSRFTGSLLAETINIGNTASFLATLASNTVVSSTGSFELAGWTSSGGPRHDIGDNFAESTGVFSAPADGLYFLSGMIRVDEHSIGYIGLNLALNGSPQADFWTYVGASGLDDTFDNVQVNAIYNLTAGDKVSLYVTSPGDSDYTVGKGSRFTGYQLK
jgi:hypothetical protein